MSSSSVVGQAAHATTHLGDWTGANAGSNPFEWLNPITAPYAAYESATNQSAPPPPQQAGPAPTLASATTTALNSQLQNEMKLRASNTLFSGASGFNENPKTASQSLLGY